MKRRLHIGGREVKEGWEILDALPGDHVDHLMDARDLSAFSDDSFSEIYASHVLEHMDYKDELDATLREWWRVLAPGGTLSLSVPDLDVLCSAILARDKLALGDRFYAMQMLFGGHVDEYDYHKVGLNQDILAAFLTRAGFVGLGRVPAFNLFKDSSLIAVAGVPISLNMTAKKPNNGKRPAAAGK